MPKPKTAEELLEALDKFITRDGEWDTKGEALLACRAYARQQVEAWKEGRAVQ